ncbi:hypothetical protein CTI12_AA060490 [Artemisia annua]|uniref:Uncharacterized protein n=1 Tax=Artemisia annua TaxID=35608 RepID=A0A2U1Q946_ARTAN|nr:hypothetical protein CTI12_AA060490 [Artemisia annua]
MVKLKEIMANKTVIGLVLGQILSLLITSTGFSSSELARRGLRLATTEKAATDKSLLIQRAEGEAESKYLTDLCFACH